MADRKNPHAVGSPEWQLWDCWNTGDLLVVSANDDIRRAENRRSGALARKQKYAEALAKLGHPVVADK